jgi:hypothetical protein
MTQTMNISMVGEVMNNIKSEKIQYEIFKTNILKNLHWLQSNSVSDELDSYFDHTAMVADTILGTLSLKDVENNRELKRDYQHLMMRTHWALEESKHFGIKDNEGCCDICIRFFHRYRYEQLHLCYCDECETT